MRLDDIIEKERFPPEINGFRQKFKPSKKREIKLNIMEPTTTRQGKLGDILNFKPKKIIALKKSTNTIQKNKEQNKINPEDLLLSSKVPLPTFENRSRGRKDLIIRPKLIITGKLGKMSNFKMLNLKGTARNNSNDYKLNNGHKFNLEKIYGGEITPYKNLRSSNKNINLFTEVNERPIRRFLENSPINLSKFKGRSKWKANGSNSIDRKPITLKHYLESNFLPTLI